MHPKQALSHLQKVRLQVLLGLASEDFFKKLGVALVRILAEETCRVNSGPSAILSVKARFGGRSFTTSWTLFGQDKLFLPPEVLLAPNAHPATRISKPL